MCWILNALLPDGALRGSTLNSTGAHGHTKPSLPSEPCIRRHHRSILASVVDGGVQLKTRYQSLSLKPVRVGAGCFLGVILFVTLLVLLQASSDAGTPAAAAPVIVSDHADVKQPLTQSPREVRCNAAEGSSVEMMVSQAQGSNVELIGSYNTSSSVYAVSVVGNTAYVGSQNGLLIIDVSNPISPTLLGSYNTTSKVEDVSVVGNLAYVVDGGGLVIIDVSDPADPIFLGYYEHYTVALGVDVSGSRAYVTGFEEDLGIVDVSDPANPSQLGYWAGASGASDVSVVGNLAYLAAYAGLQIIDVSDPSTPSLLGSYDASGILHDIHVVGNYRLCGRWCWSASGGYLQPQRARRGGVVRVGG